MSAVSRRKFLAASAASAVAPLVPRLFSMNQQPDRTTDRIPAANTAFGCDLYAQLRSDSGNIFFSPFSISTALAMTACGAKGKTLAEMQKVLHLPLNTSQTHSGYQSLLAALNGEGKPADKRGFELSVANALWGMKGYPWRDEFLKVTVAHYGAGLVEVDFGNEPAARARINTWIAERTNQKIQDLIPKGLLDALTRMVLTNAVYFKGQWEREFDKKLTKDGAFTRTDGSKIDVPLMHKKAAFRYTETDALQAVELPYKGGETAMLVILPRRSDGLAAVENDLTPAVLQQVQNSLRSTDVVLTLPRFKTETKYTLNDPLKALGISEAFNDRTADFSGMHTSPEILFVDKVLHKAFVEVNEEGTEAAAATAVVIATRAAPVPKTPKVFKADRPFLYVIRHTPTNTVLFVGRFEKP